MCSVPICRNAGAVSAAVKTLCVTPALEDGRMGIRMDEGKDIRKEELKKEIHGKIVKKDK